MNNFATTVTFRLSSEERLALFSLAQRLDTSPAQLATAGVKLALASSEAALRQMIPNRGEGGELTPWRGTVSGPGYELAAMLRDCFSGEFSSQPDNDER